MMMREVARGLRLSGNETGGSVQRVNVSTGALATLCDRVDGRGPIAPNDLAFDRHGGFSLTDPGKPRPAARIALVRTGIAA